MLVISLSSFHTAKYLGLIAHFHYMKGGNLPLAYLIGFFSCYSNSSVSFSTEGLCGGPQLIFLLFHTVIGMSYSASQVQHQCLLQVFVSSFPWAPTFGLVVRRGIHPLLLWPSGLGI